jgi:hypothetical protein
MSKAEFKAGRIRRMSAKGMEVFKAGRMEGFGNGVAKGVLAWIQKPYDDRELHNASFFLGGGK